MFLDGPKHNRISNSWKVLKYGWSFTLLLLRILTLGQFWSRKDFVPLDLYLSFPHAKYLPQIKVLTLLQKFFNRIVSILTIKRMWRTRWITNGAWETNPFIRSTVKKIHDFCWNIIQPKYSLAKERATALQDLMYVELWSPESSTTTWESYSMIKEAAPALRDTCIPQSTAVGYIVIINSGFN